MKRIPILAAVASISLFTGCTGGDVSSQSDVTTESASVVLAPVVSPSEGDRLVRDGAILIDVRTPGEFAEERIEGALLYDVSSPSFRSDIQSLSPDETYVVYCRSGNRSVPATEMMMEAGLDNMYNMGGIIDWSLAGMPTISG